jgi:hypothetical protein
LDGNLSAYTFALPIKKWGFFQRKKETQRDDYIERYYKGLQPCSPLKMRTISQKFFESLETAASHIYVGNLNR